MDVNPRRLMEWRRFNKGISSSPPLRSPPLRYPIFNCTACSAVHPLGDIAYQIEQGRGEGRGGFLLVAQDIQCVQGRGCQSQSACLPDHCISILANSEKPLCNASREGRSRPLIKTTSTTTTMIDARTRRLIGEGEQIGEGTGKNNKGRRRHRRHR